MSKVITHEMFILQTKSTIDPTVKIVGKYIKSSEKILCKCLLCGHEWKSLPGNIKAGKGCPKCMHSAKINKKKKNKAKDKLYNYVKNNCSFILLNDYVNAKTPVKCKCNICNHEWFPLPGNILKGQGCPKCGRKSCSNKLKISKEDLLKNFPKNIDILDYTKSSAYTPLKCKICGYEWFGVPSVIIKYNRGCPICTNRKRTTITFKKELEIINPNIDILDSYVNSVTKIKCKCKLCSKIWYSDPHHLLRGTGCPHCNKSKGENIIQKWLDKYNIPYTFQYHLIQSNKHLFIDFMIEYNNKVIFIEYNGIQHYQPIDFFGGVDQFEKQQLRDIQVKKYCIKHNINFIEFKYSDSVEYIERTLKEIFTIIE